MFYSQQGEDMFIYRNFINKPREDGIFIELGAHDGITYSNTKFFEDKLLFSGILIEPIKSSFLKLEVFRPKCLCINNIISTKDGDVIVYENGAVSGVCC